MRYEILKDGEVVNAIVADNAFVESYCEKHGYTFAQLPDPAPRTKSVPATTEQRVADLEEAMELLLSGATGEEVPADDA